MTYEDDRLKSLHMSFFVIFNALITKALHIILANTRIFV